MLLRADWSSSSGQFTSISHPVHPGLHHIDQSTVSFRNTQHSTAFLQSVPGSTSSLLFSFFPIRPPRSCHHISSQTNNKTDSKLLPRTRNEQQATKTNSRHVKRSRPTSIRLSERGTEGGSFRPYEPDHMSEFSSFFGNLMAGSTTFEIDGSCEILLGAATESGDQGR